MLSKIMKHEIKATYRYIVLLDIAAVISTLILVLMDRLSINFTGIGELLEVLIVMTYTIVMIAAGLCTGLIPAFRFYKSMFTNEGYLTNTLPVKSHTIIAGKALIYALWNVVFLVAVGISVLIFLSGAGFIEDIRDIIVFFHEIAALTPGIYLTLLWAAVVSLFFSIGSVYVSCAIGNLFANHKLIASIVAYFVLNQAVQIISIFLLWITAMGNTALFNNDLANYATGRDIFYAFSPYIYGGIILYTLLTVLFFWLTDCIVARKLNLQ